MSVTVDLPVVRASEAARRRGARGGYWRGVVRRLRRDPVTVVCALILVTIIVLAIAAPLVAPANPYKTSMLNRLLAPGAPHHVLGTDELGRDMLTRLIYGGRLSLFMGLTPVVNALLIGGALGILAGYVGGAINTGIMRTLEVFFAFPSVLLAISLSGALGAGIGNTLLSLTIVFIAPIARVAEAVTTQIRALDYIEAARASGAGALTVIRVHVLRVVLGPDLHLCVEPDQRLDHPRLGPVVPRARRQAAGAGMGPDAEHTACGDLYQSGQRDTAGGDDLHHLDLLQPGQRRAAGRDGCKGIAGAAMITRR